MWEGNKLTLALGVGVAECEMLCVGLGTALRDRLGEGTDETEDVERILLVGEGEFAVQNPVTCSQCCPAVLHTLVPPVEAQIPPVRQRSIVHRSWSASQGEPAMSAVRLHTPSISLQTTTMQSHESVSSQLLHCVRTANANSKNDTRTGTRNMKRG